MKYRDYQVEAHKAMTEFFLTKNKKSGLLCIPTGGGKCLHPNTMLIMANGSIKPIKDVTIGEQVMGDDGTPRNVVGITTGIAPQYRISQKNGITYYTNNRHLLCLVHTSVPKSNRSNKTINISAEDYIELSKYTKHILKGYKANRLTFSDKDLPIPPRFLGIWLGDGSSHTVEVTSADYEIMGYMCDLAIKTGLEFHLRDQHNNKAKMCRISRGNISQGPNAIHKSLDRLGVLHNKHIPLIYKTSSIKQRLELLAGLIDTDGHNSKNRYYEIIQKSKELANDIAFVARSLGYRVSIKRVKKTIKSIKFSGFYYRINISGPVSEIPVLIPRKKIAGLHPNKNHLRYAIDVQKVSDNELYCGIEIDGNHKHLLEDFTVVHNTACAAKWLYDNFITQGKKVFWAAHRRELLDQAKDTFLRIDPKIDIGEWNSKTKSISPSLTLISIPSTILKLPHKSQPSIIVIDEAHHSEAKTWNRFIKSQDPDKKLGLTASPERLDGKALNFEAIVYRKSLMDLVKLGYAPRPCVYMMKTNKKYSMAINHGDFTEMSLDQLNEEERNKIVIDEYEKNHTQYRKTLAFACNKKHAYSLESELAKRNLGIKSIVITSDLPDRDRDLLVERMRNGEFDIVISVGIFTEGFDWPNCNTVFLARPTLSKGLMLQMIGRGSRLSLGAHDISTSEKKTFNVVYFIDDIHSYATVCEQWAVNLLGLQNKEIKKRVEESEKEEKVVEALKKHEIRKSDPKVKQVTGLERSLLDIRAVGTYSNKVDSNKKVVLTSNDVLALQLLEEYVKKSDNPYTAIESSWGILSDTIDISPREWKSLCWSWYYSKVKGQDVITSESNKNKGKEGKVFDLTFIEHTPTPEEGVRSTLTRMLEEHKVADSGVANRAATVCSMAITKALGIGLINKEVGLKFLSYKDKIFTLGFRSLAPMAYRSQGMINKYLNKVFKSNFVIKITQCT